MFGENPGSREGQKPQVFCKAASGPWRPPAVRNARNRLQKGKKETLNCFSYFSISDVYSWSWIRCGAEVTEFLPGSSQGG